MLSFLFDFLLVFMFVSVANSTLLVLFVFFVLVALLALLFFLLSTKVTLLSAEMGYLVKCFIAIISHYLENYSGEIKNCS